MFTSFYKRYFYNLNEKDNCENFNDNINEKDNCENLNENLNNIKKINEVELYRPYKSPSFPLNPPKDIKALNDDETCKICLTNKIRTINLDCEHLVFCFKCSKDFVINNTQHKCPLCRKFIIKIKIDNLNENNIN